MTDTLQGPDREVGVLFDACANRRRRRIVGSIAVTDIALSDLLRRLAARAAIADGSRNGDDEVTSRIASLAAKGFASSSHRRRRPSGRPSRDRSRKPPRRVRRPRQGGDGGPVTGVRSDGRSQRRPARCRSRQRPSRCERDDGPPVSRRRPRTARPAPRSLLDARRRSVGVRRRRGRAFGDLRTGRTDRRRVGSRRGP